jgi:hypothetical protein
LLRFATPTLGPDQPDRTSELIESRKPSSAARAPRAEFRRPSLDKAR